MMSTNFKQEFVLSLVHSYMKTASEQLNCRLVSKYLLDTGNHDPSRILPTTFAKKFNGSRTTEQKLLVETVAKRNKVIEAYLPEELSKIHEQILKLPCYDILGINASLNSYLTIVNPLSLASILNNPPGWYLPVVYKGQRKIYYSMIFDTQKHTNQEALDFCQFLATVKLTAVYNNKRQSFLTTHRMRLYELNKNKKVITIG